MQWEHDDAVRSTTRRARIVEVDDSKSQQRVDLRGLKNEKPKKIWRPQDFGYTSNPPKDSDGIMEQMGGRSDRTVYRDGGHEKYRPKKTPEGCSALFNMHGDIIRVFKENADVVHQKKVNIRVGKGYAAGESGAPEGDTDDKSGEDATTIAIVLDGDTITLTYDDSSVKIESGKITLTSPHVVVKSDHVDLGDEGGTPVGLCGGGCATKVFAV
jgi:phage gp45-like